MSAPSNSRQVGRFRYYDFREFSAPSVTTILDALPAWHLLKWYAKQAALAAVSKLSENKTTADVIAALAEEEWLSHEATKTHQTRHKNKCPWTPNAAGWLARAPERYRDQKGERGSFVHQAAEFDTDISDVPEAGQLAYGSYRQWVEDFNPIILAKEGQVFNTTALYAGSFDLIAEVNGIVYLIDLKTSSSIRHNYRLQLAAYRYGGLCVIGNDVDDHATDALERVERCAILHLTDDGYEFVEVDAGLAEHSMFLNVYRVWQFMADTEHVPVGFVVEPPAVAAA